ncbi:MAG: transposase [Thermoleophilaceae bacterium]|nr:transposase [Thermoleophilaceae bacterium]
MGRNRKPRRKGVLLPEETKYFTDRVFHVWGRAIDDMHTFPERRDKAEFLDRIERHMSPREIRDSTRRPYRKLTEKAEVIAFCILDNHYHLLILQKQEGGVIELMRALLTSYGRYFNDTHGRRAQIFESPYSARPAEDHDDVRSLIGYIHGNHEVIGPDYEFCSHREYVGDRNSDWVASGLGLLLFSSIDGYRVFAFTEWEASRKRKRDHREANPLPARRHLKRGRGGHLPSPQNPDSA